MVFQRQVHAAREDEEDDDNDNEKDNSRGRLAERQ